MINAQRAVLQWLCAEYRLHRAQTPHSTAPMLVLDPHMSATASDLTCLPAQEDPIAIFIRCKVTNSILASILVVLVSPGS